MKKFLFAVALGLLSSVPVAADEPRTAPAPAPTPVPASTVIGTTTPSTAIYSSDSGGTTRRGLLGRLRGRTNRGTAMTTIPTVPTTGTIITTPGTTGGTIVPAPMPPVITPRPSGATSTTGTPAVAGNPVVVAGGVVDTNVVIPAGGSYMMTADGQIVMVGGMMPAPMMMSSDSRMSTGRTGLIARLRARR